jgi:LysM repeat protein
MQRKNSPQYVINSYQRKRRIGPFLIWGIAGIIFGAGILLLILWFKGGGGSLNIGSLFASATPTATETFTPTPTVPTNTPTMTPTETETPTPTMTPTPEGPQMYTVEEGDNCWSIAVDKFGVNIELFMMINNMTECNINIGDQVIIPPANMEMPTLTPIPLDQYTQGQRIEYQVEMNDSYMSIASKFNTTLDSLQKLNEIEDILEFPQMGQILQIAVNLVTPTPTPVPTYTEVPAE